MAFLTHSFVVFDKLVGSASFLSSQKIDLMYLPQLREFQGQEISPLQSSDDETYLLWYLIYLISHIRFWYLMNFLNISLPFTLPSPTWHPLCIPVLPVVQICQIALQRNFSCFIWNTRFVIVSSSEIQNSFFICSRNYISVSHEGHWAVRNCFHGCLPESFEYYAWAAITYHPNMSWGKERDK